MFQFRQRLIMALCRSKRALARHVGVGVCKPDNPPPQRDLFAPQSRRITCSIQRFVVVLNRLLHALAAGYGANNFRAHPRMRFDMVKLVFRERAGLVQNSLGNKNLDQVRQLLRPHSERAPDHLRIAPHGVAMTGGLDFPALRGAVYIFDRLAQDRQVAVFAS